MDAALMLFEAGCAAWPGLAVPLDAFTAFAAEREATPERAPDLYLACACAAGVPGATEAFVDRFAPRVPSWLGRHGGRAELVDEVCQTVVVRCLVGDRPAIGTYTGRGSLEGWVRAIATREALAIVRREGRTAEEGEAAELLASDEEIAALKRAYREPVLAAFQAAGRGLAPPHRALLRMHYVHGLTTASLAQMYGVGRATLVRRIAEAREALVEGVRAELGRTAGVQADDVESVLRLVRSQVDLRLSLVLAEP